MPLNKKNPSSNKTQKKGKKGPLPKEKEPDIIAKFDIADFSNSSEEHTQQSFDNSQNNLSSLRKETFITQKYLVKHTPFKKLIANQRPDDSELHQGISEKFTD